MKKRTSMLILSLLILCLAPMQMLAAEINEAKSLPIEPKWTSIIEFTNSFDISSGGTAQFDTVLFARSNIDKVVINASIQQYVNGNWQTVNSWSSTTYSNSGYLNKKWALMSGYYYRLVSTGAVYEDGILVEQTSYTGSSYWY